MTDLAVEVAQHVSGMVERRFCLAPGTLLGAAWQGAASAAKRWRPDGGASLKTVMSRRAFGACLDAIRDDGELDGLNRGRRARGVVVFRGFLDRVEDDDSEDLIGVRLALESALSVPAPNMTARLEVDEAVAELALRSGSFATRVFVLGARDGLTLRETAARFGASESYMSQLRKRAAEAAKDMRGTA